MHRVMMAVVVALLGAARVASAEQVFVNTVLGFSDNSGLGTLNRLVRFDSTTPGATTSVVITGLRFNEGLVGIDFRPATGQLYGLGLKGQLDDFALYILDPETGAATFVGTPLFLGAPSFGFDFDPVNDVIRVVDDSRRNTRIDPTTAMATSDTILQYAVGDPNVAANPDIRGIAYSDNMAGAAQTTLFGIDSSLEILVRVGGVNGAPSPSTGTLTTIGSLTVTLANSNLGFDISGATGIAYAMLQPSTGSGSLYTIDLATGAATLIGEIGGIGGTGVGLAVGGPPLLHAAPALQIGGLLVLTTTLMFIGAALLLRRSH